MKHKIYIGLIALSFNAVAQPVGAPAPFATNPNQAVTTSNFAWYRGGNNAGGPAGNNNIFGTAAGFNSAIFTQTNGFTRTRLNGDLTTVIQSVNQNVSGYMGLSFNPGGPSFFDNNSPRTMLHIDGPNNTAFTGDWRRWMRTGTYYRENSDAMYVGMKQEGLNRSDAVINWSDDNSAGGPDVLRFIFTSTSDGNGGGNLNPRNGAGLNGYEYMRMLPFPFVNSINSQGTPIGHIGIGPLFGNTALNAPKARIHSHTEDYFENYFQFTNEVATGMQFNDGFKVGIGGFQNSTTLSGHAYIYNQEERSILFSTNHAAPTSVNIGAADATADFERMRISSNTTPTYIGNQFAFTPFNPANLQSDLTRVSISHNPTNPLNRPLALLHLGYNTGTIGNILSTDGWRPWMDVGMLVSQGSDNVYIGLKPEGTATSFGDRQDAVIAWGDNYTNTNPITNIGPDKLRIIFTSPEVGQTAAGPGAMSAAEGLEFVRYVPFHNTSLNANDPRTGFGDFNSLLPAGTIDPGNTVEINSIMNGFNATANTNVTGSYVGSTGASGLRFRDLTSQSLVVVPDSLNKIDVTKVLSVDTLGNVVLINGAASGTGLGNLCSDTIKKPLTGDYEIPMAGFNFNFTNPVNSSSSFHIGSNVCMPTVARLNVYNDNLQVAGAFSSNLNTATNSFGIFSDIINSGTGNLVSVQGTANSSGTGSSARGVRGEAIANNGSIAEGVKGITTANNNCQQNIAVGGLSRNGTAISIAGDFDVEQSNSPVNHGVNIEVINGINPAATNIGINASANSTGTENYGGIFVANGATNNYAVFAQAPITAVQTPGSVPAITGNYAGYFNGDVVRTGTDNFTSDQILKQNIDSITNALGIINQLKPKSYEYKQSSFPSMNLPGGKQYGLIAQEVQTILPELVNNNVHPAKVDSLGNIIVPAFNYLSLEYQQLTGIMIKAIQEQQAKIDSLTKQLNSKDSIQDARLAALENAIAQCCSNATARNNNSTINQLDVELSDKDAIVLNQNVPNPFAEQTTITYNVPTSIEKAQLIFFNTNGQVIQTVDIKTRGKGKVNVFASDLSSGLYHYTLVADGKVVDSKKMVRE